MAIQAPQRTGKIYARHTPPDPDAKQVGTTAEGLPIYEVERYDFTNTPLRDKDGELVYSRNSVTGERLIQRRHLETKKVKVLVVPNNEGNANLSWVRYTPPTPEELAAKDRERKVAEMIPALAGALVDKGLTPDDLLNRAAPVTETVSLAHDRGMEATDETESHAGVAIQDDAPPVDSEYPRHLGFGKWALSDGSEIRGTRAEAEAKQATLGAAV